MWLLCYVGVRRDLVPVQTGKEPGRLPKAIGDNTQLSFQLRPTPGLRSELARPWHSERWRVALYPTPGGVQALDSEK